jgi:Zn-dependent protease with chaperone function
LNDFISIWHYDGDSAIKRSPELEIVGRSFLLVEREWRTGPFAFADLVWQGMVGNALVYGLAGKDGWRLGIEGPIPDELAAKLPLRRDFGGWIDRVGWKRAAVVFTVVSALVIGAALKVPEWVAPFVPKSWEAKMGDAMVGDLGGRICHTPAGDKALAKLVSALEADPSDLHVMVANIDMVNAAALPGGKVLLFNGLVREAKSADEVAGVLAHEIGHVRERHVMQSLLRQLGLSALMGGLDGAAGSGINTIVSMGYSREAEREADDWSIAALRRAAIAPDDTAKFFAKLAKAEKAIGGDTENSLIGYISSHPMSAQRRDIFAGSRDKSIDYRPALTPEEWAALKSMCKNDKKVKGDGGLFL